MKQLTKKQQIAKELKKVPKRYKGWKIKIVKSKTFVATSKNHIIPVNYWYVIQPGVDINDIEAIFEHEIEEDLEFRKRHKPLAIAHSMATLKEKKFLKKLFLMKIHLYLLQ